MRQIWLFAAAVLWVSATTLAAPPAGPTASPHQLQAWLAQLDDESFARREEAIQRLHAAGEASIEVLAQGSLSSSPEVAWRAGEALKRIAITGNDRTLDRVATALERVGKQGRGGMNKVVLEIRARQKQIRHDRAAAQIRQLGGGLAGGYGGFPGGGMFFGGFDAGMMVPVAVDLEVAAPAEVADEVARVEAAVDAAASDEAAEAAAKAKIEAAEAALEASVKEKPELPAPKTLELLEELERLFAPAKPAPPPEAAPAIEAIREVVAIDDFGGMVFMGGDIAVEGAQLAESLSLDANWRGGDKGLAVLRDLPEIAMVNIQGAKLTDEALAHLAALPKLRSITIRETKFSAAALRKLHRSKPEAYMYCQGEAMIGIHADTTGSCVLTSIYPGSGAADAGLAAGDKVVAIDDLDVRDFSELTIAVYARRPGEKLKIEVERDGKRQTVQVELKARKVLEP